MISERTKALLDAAATIYITKEYSDAGRAEAVAEAYALLGLIEAREKANAPTSIQLDRCYWCSVALPAEGSAHLAGCPGRH